MALTKIDDRGLKTPIDLLDNEKIRFGTGNDLEIYHNGAHNYVYGATTGQNVTIGAKSGYINLQPVDNEEGIIVKNNGAVELYYDNVKKFETTSGGVQVNGDFKILNGGDDIFFDASENWMRWDDNVKIQCGNSGDLNIYHDGTNSHLYNATGEFKIRGNDVRLMNAAGNEHMLIGTANGSVNLYYDNVKKFETLSNGIAVEGKVDLTNGHLYLDDNYAARFGTGEDLLIYHDSSTNKSIIKETGSGSFDILGNWVQIKNEAGTEDKAIFKDDGAVELYHDNSKKLETTSSGIEVPSTSGMSGIVVSTTAASDAEIEFINTNSDNRTWAIGLDQSDSKSFVIANAAAVGASLSSSERALVADVNGAVELYYDNSKKFATRSNGVHVWGIAQFDDSSSTDTGRIRMGDDSDFQIYHDGTNTYLKNATGKGAIKPCADAFYAKNAADNEYILRADAGGAGFLYYSGNEKLKTTSSGITVTGSVTTQDINLSNLNAPTPNEVDSTRGSWTMQEGADDLFLINRSNGKKYKFNLTEIS